jgi:hypothetical protein
MSTRRHGEGFGFKNIALYYLSLFVEDPPSWSSKGKRIEQTGIDYLYFESKDERDLALILLSGRLAVWWWGINGDDFHLTKGLLMSFPISLEQVSGMSRELVSLSKKLQKELPKHPLVTKYAGKEMGNYDMSRCRHITDESDQLILRALGLDEFWCDILLADAGLAKVTGERPGTRRSWPFPL